MSGIKYFPKNLDIKGKTILLRLDLNVPLKDKIIQDHTRIDQILPFIKELVDRKSKIIILSHIGRPKGIKDFRLSILCMVPPLPVFTARDKNCAPYNINTTVVMASPV